MARRKKLDTTLLRLDKHLLEILICAWRAEMLWLKKAKKSQMHLVSSRFLLLNNNYNLFANVLSLKTSFFDQYNYRGVFFTSFRHFNFNSIFEKNLANLFNYNTVAFTFQTPRIQTIQQLQTLENNSNLILLNAQLFNKIVNIPFYFQFLRFNLLYSVKVVSLLKLLNFYFIRQFFFILNYQLFHRIGILVNILKTR